TIGRHFREGGRNVVRNGWMSFASISAISISLFILGMFLLLTLNVGKLADSVEGQVEIHAFLDVGLTDEQLDTIHNDIGSIPEVSSVTFVSKEEGLEIVKEKFGKDADILEGYEGDLNPLPDSFTVKVDEPRNVGFVAEQIKNLYKGRVMQPIID